ncbi:collagen alpha-5(IV) chain-like [Motacilla alba alba]|uniref:collagen alpha-5(IV) chain-like n=1 Tax=Motacilla alba alba TaxID=1094192 RepID=UPI0018D522C5|nr:collagen alpha-5(IV) chain-like [Motacilla alba alba]
MCPPPRSRGRPGVPRPARSRAILVISRHRPPPGVPPLRGQPRSRGRPGVPRPARSRAILVISRHRPPPGVPPLRGQPRSRGRPGVPRPARSRAILVISRHRPPPGVPPLRGQPRSRGRPGVPRPARSRAILVISRHRPPPGVPPLRGQPRSRGRAGVPRPARSRAILVISCHRPPPGVPPIRGQPRSRGRACVPGSRREITAASERPGGGRLFQPPFPPNEPPTFKTKTYFRFFEFLALVYFFAGGRRGGLVVWWFRAFLGSRPPPPFRFFSFPERMALLVAWNEKLVWKTKIFGGKLYFFSFGVQSIPSRADNRQPVPCARPADMLNCRNSAPPPLQPPSPTRISPPGAEKLVAVLRQKRLAASLDASDEEMIMPGETP